MPTRIALFSLLVPDYDDALACFLRIGFECREDTDLGNGKRWIRIAPRDGEIEILLARAVGDRQGATIGEQGGERVWLFLETKNLEADYRQMRAVGVQYESFPARAIRAALPNEGTEVRSIGDLWMKAFYSKSLKPSKTLRTVS